MLLLDMDNTLNYLSDHFFKCLSDMFITYDKNYHSDYDMSQFIHLETRPERKKIMAKIFSTKGFWIAIPPQDHAIEAAKYLNEKYDVVIATVPWASAVTCKSEKIEWINHYLPFIDTNKQISWEPNKWELKGDIIIDDKPSNLVKCLLKKVTVARDYEYNRHVNTTFRIKDWSEVYKIL